MSSTPFRRLFALSMLLHMSGVASAGEAVNETMRCPFGNERVTFTSTHGCSQYGDQRRMSLAPVTSCDFIEPLPQCAESRVPLYRDFTRQEVSQLKAFSKTDTYAQAAAISRFYLAYAIEKELSPENAEIQYAMLRNGYWFDSPVTYPNDMYFAAFREAANAYVKSADAPTKAFIWSMAAYAHALRGNADKTRELLRAVRASVPDDTLLIHYASLVEKCLNSPAKDECNPEFKVTFPD